MAALNRFLSTTIPGVAAMALCAGVAICLCGCGQLYEVNNPPAGWLQGDRALVEARILLPLTDRAGRPFPQDRIAWVESELVRRYGTFVNEGEYEQESQAPYMAPLREQVRRYMISLRRDQEEGLKHFLQSVKQEFGQRDIYLSIDRRQGVWI